MGGRGGGHAGFVGQNLPAIAAEPAGDENGDGAFQAAVDCVCIHGGASSFPSMSAFKRMSHELNAAEPTPRTWRPLKWSNQVITFDSNDHPDCTVGLGVLPLVMSPTIQNLAVSKMLVDGGSGLNLLSINAMETLQIPLYRLQPTGAFQGANQGLTHPLGQITLSVTFREPKNFRTKDITFDIADILLPYHGILGRPALAKFMAASHYAYNVLKILSQAGIISVKADSQDAIFCVDVIPKAAMVVRPRNGQPLPRDNDDNFVTVTLPGNEASVDQPEGSSSITPAKLLPSAPK